MKTKILNINIPEPLPEDFDPLLGKSVSEYFGSVHRISSNSKPKSSVSVFDIDQKPEVAEIANEPNRIESESQPDDAKIHDEELIFGDAFKTEKIALDAKSEKDFNGYQSHDLVANDRPPYENIGEPAQPSQTEIVATVDDLGTQENHPLEYETLGEDEIRSLDSKPTKDFNSYQSHDLTANDKEAYEDLSASTDIYETIKDDDAPHESPNKLEGETTAYDERLDNEIGPLDSKPKSDFNSYAKHELISDKSPELMFSDASTAPLSNTQTQTEEEFTHTGEPYVLSEHDIEQMLADEKSVENASIDQAQETGELPPSTIIDPVIEKPKRRQKVPRIKKSAKSVKKSIKPSYLFGGIFFSGLGALLLLTSMLAPLGAPFDDISSLAPYWFVFALVGFCFWIGTRRIPWIIISGLVALVYLTNIVPWMGIAPRGGSQNRHTIGFANIEDNDKAYTQFIKEAEKNKAEIVLLANASRLKDAPAGWNLVSIANPKDPTSLAVLSKTDWRATSQSGEPTIAKPSDNWLTVIGTNPKDPSTTKRTTPEREALINRTANRAGMEEGPVLVLGDFAATPWDRAMQDFTKTSGLTRIRCGGYLGTTFSKGIFGLAFDHSYFKNLNVQACKIGSRLNKSNHSPIFVSVAPKTK